MALKRKILVWAVAVGSVLCGVLGTWALYTLFAPVPIHPAVEIAVGPGEPARTIAYRLEQRGIVRSRYAMILMARVGNRDRHIRHGLHVFAGKMTPSEVVDELIRRPPQASVVVTIPEGRTFREIGVLLEEAGVVAAADYEAAVCDPAVKRRAGAGPEANCVEGYLFPDTYAFTRSMTAAAIVGMQLGRFEEVIAELLPRVEPSEANALPSTERGLAEEPWVPAPGELSIADAPLNEVVVLASIVEKETGVASERSMVSSVFHNRLRRNMRLQADPTAIYGVYAAGGEWDGTKLHELLRQPGPYNTYTRAGLPPGPICNPGRDALLAALAPAVSEYLYFVADGDGAHRFSTTLAEHNRAVARLRKRSGG